jgi:hypothetical protein
MRLQVDVSMCTAAWRTLRNPIQVPCSPLKTLMLTYRYHMVNQPCCTNEATQARSYSLVPQPERGVL